MGNRIYLQMQLQKAVRKYGENAPVTLEIKRQIAKLSDRNFQANTRSFCKF